MKASVTQNFEGTINGYIIFDLDTFAAMHQIIKKLELRFKDDTKMLKTLNTFEFAECLFEEVNALQESHYALDKIVDSVSTSIASCYRFKDECIGVTINISRSLIDYLMKL